MCLHNELWLTIQNFGADTTRYICIRDSISNSTRNFSAGITGYVGICM